MLEPVALTSSSSSSVTDLNMAIELWKLILKDKFHFLDLWIEFLQVSVPNLFRVLRLCAVVPAPANDLHYRKTASTPSPRTSGLFSSILPT